MVYLIEFIAELLRAWVEPHTSENLVIHRSERLWLSRDCPSICLYVCPSICKYLENYESSTITIAISLIWGIRVMVNWQLSQAIHWPVSHDYIAGSSKLCVFEIDCWPVTVFFQLYHRLRPGYFSRGGGSMHKGKISAQINPWRIVDFSSDIFLAQLSLGKSLIYCVCNFYNLGYTYCV